MKKTELIEKEKEKERSRDFHTHVKEPCYDRVLPVPRDYDYTRKGFWNRVGSFFAVGIFRLAGLFISPFCRLRIEGRKNLRQVGAAVLTSNHISDIDCVLIRRAVGGRKLRITVADFNNRKGVFGAMLRAGGTMPFGTSAASFTNLSKALTEYLSDDYLVLFYPEGALWWCYEKPRPLLDGAFYCARRNNVPVVPMFFTFRPLGRRRDGTERKRFTLHIGAPIYPDPSLPVGRDVARLRDLTYRFNVDTYRKAYGKDPEYLPQEQEDVAMAVANRE